MTELFTDLSQIHPLILIMLGFCWGIFIMCILSLPENDDDYVPQLPEFNEGKCKYGETGVRELQTQTGLHFRCNGAARMPRSHARLSGNRETKGGMGDYL